MMASSGHPHREIATLVLHDSLQIFRWAKCWSLHFHYNRNSFLCVKKVLFDYNTGTPEFVRSGDFK